MLPKLDGFNVKEITLYTEEELSVGMAVSLDANYTAAKTFNGNNFAGFCTAVRGNYVTVAVTGVVTVPYTGEAPSIGFDTLVADGTGGVKYSSSSTIDYLILAVDEEKQLVTFML